MEKLFHNILGQGETLIKTIKPNKTKFFFIRVVWAIVILMLFTTIGILTCTVRDDAGNLAPIGLTISIFVVGVIFSLAVVLIAIASYAKRFYAITNKRLLICHGVFVASYKMLDIDKIGAINVNVSLFDKMIGKKTGSISFGSVASPITQDEAYFTFDSVQDVYDFYNEIKTITTQTQQVPSTSKKKYISKQKSE